MFSRRDLFAAAPGLLLCLLFQARPAGADEAGYEERAARTLLDCTVHSRVGPQETPLSMPAANFLLDHPDLSAEIARRNGLAPYRVSMRGPLESWVDDGAGTRGLVVLLDRQAGRRTYFGDGMHSSLVFPDIHATAVVRLDQHLTSPAGAPPVIESDLDVCVRVTNPFVSGLVKVLKPFLRKLILRKFSKAFLVAHAIGERLAKDPAPIVAEILAYPGLSEEQRVSARAIFSAAERAR